MTTSKGDIKKAAPRTVIQVWQLEMKMLRARLHSASRMKKLRYYRELKVLESKIASAQAEASV
jgi:hypothetical protein